MGLTAAQTDRLYNAGKKINQIGTKMDTLAGDETGEGGLMYRLEGAGQMVAGFGEVAGRVGVAAGALLAKKPSFAVAAFSGITDTLNKTYEGVDKLWFGSDQAIKDHYKSAVQQLAENGQDLLENPETVPVEPLPPNYPIPPDYSSDFEDLQSDLESVSSDLDFLRDRAQTTSTNLVDLIFFLRGVGSANGETIEQFLARRSTGELSGDTGAIGGTLDLIDLAKGSADVAAVKSQDAATSAGLAQIKAEEVNSYITAACLSLALYPLNLAGSNAFQADVAAGIVTGEDSLISLRLDDTTGKWVPVLNPKQLTVLSPSGDARYAILGLLIDVVNGFNLIPR